MGNDCNQCEPVVNCGREALRQGLNQNGRTKLDLSNTGANDKSLKDDKKAERMLSTQDKSSEEKGIRSIEFIELSYGITLEGEFKGNARDGKSKISWPDGSQLTLNYENNRPVGTIKFTCLNQGEYEGDSDGYVAEGKGKMTLVDGSLYEGDWKEDKPHGNGVHKFPDGSTYEG